jgi:hypothetical protein
MGSYERCEEDIEMEEMGDEAREGRRTALFGTKKGCGEKESAEGCWS